MKKRLLMMLLLLCLLLRLQLLSLLLLRFFLGSHNISLPFFSYGGTALMLQLAEMGILLNVSRYMRIEARTE